MIKGVMKNPRRRVEQRDIEIQEKFGKINCAPIGAMWSQGRAAELSTRQLADHTKLPPSTIRQMNRKYGEIVELQVRANLGEIAVDCLQNMVDLAFTAEDEKTRFNATKDLLDRAGFKPKSEVDIKQEVIRRSPKEIEAEARQKLGNELAEKLLGLDKVEDAQIVET
jgi:hypothetical protein